MLDIGLVLGLLAVVAFLAAIGQRIGLPGPIVFAIGGCEPLASTGNTRNSRSIPRVLPDAVYSLAVCNPGIIHSSAV